MRKLISNILGKFGYKIEKIMPVEIFIISFPKCGRTWLNMLLGEYFSHLMKIKNVNADIKLNLNLLHQLFPNNIPLITFSHDDNENFFRTPKQLKTNKRKYAKSKVVFLVRDPRDVLVSSFFEKTKRIKLGKREKGFWKTFEGTISEYIYEQKGGFSTIIEFYNIWEKNKTIPKDFLLLKYEDLHQNTETEFIKLLKFAGIKDIKTEIVKKAVNAASFSNMQKIEKHGGTQSDKLKPTDINDTETYKTRKGKISGYKDYLSENEIKYLTSKMKEQLPAFFNY